MDRGTSYDDDIYAWSREQAAALRRLAETRRDLPNELDLEHVAEEIEVVGKSELRTVESFVELMFRHLLKVASAPDARPARHWRDEIELQRRALEKDIKNSMWQLIDVDELWDAARRRADADLDTDGDALLPNLPPACPFTLDELLAPAFDVEMTVARLRQLPGPAADERP